MTNDWIIDVLTDLNAFARDNGMLDLAEQLDDAKLVAACELLIQSTGKPGVIGVHAKTVGKRHRTIGSGGNL